MTPIYIYIVLHLSHLLYLSLEMPRMALLHSSLFPKKRFISVPLTNYPKSLLHGHTSMCMALLGTDILPYQSPGEPFMHAQASKMRHTYNVSQLYYAMKLHHCSNYLSMHRCESVCDFTMVYCAKDFCTVYHWLTTHAYTSMHRTIAPKIPEF